MSKLPERITKNGTRVSPGLTKISPALTWRSLATLRTRSICPAVSAGKVCVEASSALDLGESEVEPIRDYVDYSTSRSICLHALPGNRGSKKIASPFSAFAIDFNDLRC